MILTALAMATLWQAAASDGLAARAYLKVAHSHNDYEQRAPLKDALQAGFASVEADVWWGDGQLPVAHLPFLSRGGLEELYLGPLQARVDRLGSVYGDGEPFYLWIDLKDARPALTDELHGVLSRFPMLTVFTDEAVLPGPVVVVLTGDEEAKKRYTDGHRLRYACRDSNLLGALDPPADRRWTWYALTFDEALAAGASGAGDAGERLRALVERIHRLGRRLRLYEAPERPETWRLMLAAGVDLIGTDRLAEFRAFLERERGWRARAVAVGDASGLGAPTKPARASPVAPP